MTDWTMEEVIDEAFSRAAVRIREVRKELFAVRERAEELEAENARMRQAIEASIALLYEINRLRGLTCVLPADHAARRDLDDALTNTLQRMRDALPRAEEKDGDQE